MKTFKACSNKTFDQKVIYFQTVIINNSEHLFRFRIKKYGQSQ